MTSPCGWITALRDPTTSHQVDRLSSTSFSSLPSPSPARLTRLTKPRCLVSSLLVLASFLSPVWNLVHDLPSRSERGARTAYRPEEVYRQDNKLTVCTARSIGADHRPLSFIDPPSGFLAGPGFLDDRQFACENSLNCGRVRCPARSSRTSPTPLLETLPPRPSTPLSLSPSAKMSDAEQEWKPKARPQSCVIRSGVALLTGSGGADRLAAPWRRPSQRR